MMRFLRNLTWRRLYCKIVRQEGTPESVARGVGLGLLVCFAVPLGLHTVIALPVAFAIRANKFLTILFTMPINPYTIPIVYPAQCWLGAKLLGHDITLSAVERDFAHVFANPSWTTFKELEDDMMWPFLIGGLIFGLLAGATGYFMTLGMVQRYRRRRERALRKRLSTLAKRQETVCMKVE